MLEEIWQKALQTGSAWWWLAEDGVAETIVQLLKGKNEPTEPKQPNREVDEWLVEELRKKITEYERSHPNELHCGIVTTIEPLGIGYVMLFRDASWVKL